MRLTLRWSTGTRASVTSAKRQSTRNMMTTMPTIVSTLLSSVGTASIIRAWRAWASPLRRLIRSPVVRPWWNASDCASRWLNRATRTS